MTTHTPGPWHYRTGSVHSAVYAGCYAVGCKEPDAALIAAAPALLEALRECITDPGAFCYRQGTAQAAALARRLQAINDVARNAINLIGGT